MYILQSAQLACLIRFVLPSVCASTYFFPTVDSAPFNNSHAQKNYKSRGGKEADMLKCVSIWRANGWSACYQQNGVLCCKMAITETGKSGGQMCTGRNADTLSRSLMFTLVISNLPGICLPVLISPQRAVDIKITAIYVISMCVGRGCGQNKATL